MSTIFLFDGQRYNQVYSCGQYYPCFEGIFYVIGFWQVCLHLILNGCHVLTDDFEVQIAGGSASGIGRGHGVYAGI